MRPKARSGPGHRAHPGSRIGPRVLARDIRARSSGPAHVVARRSGFCDRLQALPGATQRQAPRSQAPTWLRDLTSGSSTSLGSVLISAFLGPTARRTASSSKPSLFAQRLRPTLHAGTSPGPLLQRRLSPSGAPLAPLASESALSSQQARPTTTARPAQALSATTAGACSGVRRHTVARGPAPSGCVPRFCGADV